MPISNFDRYIERLIRRVHVDKEVLQGDEALFYRLTGIRGETHVGGIRTYFDERFPEFDADMAALEGVGLHELAAIYRKSRRVLYGDAPLDHATVYAWLDWEEDDPRLVAAEEIDRLELGALLDELEDVRDALGLSAGLYEPG